MTAEPLRVGLLSGQDDPARLDRLVGLLSDRGVEAEVLLAAVAARGRGRPEGTVPEGLAERWRRFWSVRGLARRDDRPRLLHALGVAASGAALDLAERWRVPYLVSVEEFLPSGTVLRLSRRWCRWVVASGEALALDLAREAGLPRRLVKQVPPAVRLPTWEDRLGRSGRVPVVGAACATGAGSGLPTFLRAAREVLDRGLDVEFVIATQGPDAPARRLAEALNLSDRLTLAVGPEADRSFWAVLNVYCQPARAACAGGSLARAMAYGIPCVASEVQGLQAWIEDRRTGRLVAPGDHLGLAATVIELLADPGRAEALGRRARQHVARHFTPEAEADALARLYRDTAASADAPAAARLRVDAAPRANRRS